MPLVSRNGPGVRLPVTPSATRPIDHCIGIVAQTGPDHFPRIDIGAVDGAAEQFLEGQYPVAIVQIQAGKHLVGQMSQPGPQKAPAVGGIGQRGALLQFLAQRPPGQFQTGHQPGLLGRAQSRHRRPGGLAGQQGTQTARALQQLATQRDRSSGGSVRAANGRRRRHAGRPGSGADRHRPGRAGR